MPTSVHSHLYMFMFLFSAYLDICLLTNQMSYQNKVSHAVDLFIIYYLHWGVAAFSQVP